jgi:hypothetical protein
LASTVGHFIGSAITSTQVARIVSSMFKPRIEVLPESQQALWPALGFARAVYGNGFNTMLPLKALNYFEGGDLCLLSPSVKKLLSQAVNSVRNIPQTSCKSQRLDR